MSDFLALLSLFHQRTDYQLFWERAQPVEGPASFPVKNREYSSNPLPT